MIRNTFEDYGSVSKIVHMLTALLLAGSYLSIYAKSIFVISDSSRYITMQAHFSIGITVLVLTLLRLFWRSINTTPVPLSTSPILTFAASALHWFFYIALLCMPLTGYFFTKSDTHFFGIFQIQSFKNSGLLEYILGDSAVDFFKSASSIAATMHKFTGQYILWVAILFHAAAALYHHYVKKDRTLVRMLPW